MKGFIRVLLIVAVLYLGYKYYKDNYTEEGKQKQAKSEADKQAEQEAQRLRDRKVAMDRCRDIYNNPNLNEGEKWNQYQACEINVNATYGSN